MKSKKFKSLNADKLDDKKMEEIIGGWTIFIPKKEDSEVYPRQLVLTYGVEGPPTRD